MSEKLQSYTEIPGAYKSSEGTCMVFSNGTIKLGNKKFLLTTEHAISVIDVLTEFVGADNLIAIRRIEGLEQFNKLLLDALQEEGILTLCEDCHLPILEEDHTRTSDDVDLHKKCFNDAFEEEIKAKELEPR